MYIINLSDVIIQLFAFLLLDIAIAIVIIAAVTSIRRGRIRIRRRKQPSKAEVEEPLPIEPETTDLALIELIRQLESENEALRLELGKYKRKPSGKVRALAPLKYGWLIVACAVGFGLGLIFISMLFEMALSSFGNPLTVDYKTWDWSAQTNTWKFIGIMWILGGMVAFYLLYRVQEKAKRSSTPSLESFFNPKKTAKTDKKAD